MRPCRMRGRSRGRGGGRPGIADMPARAGRQRAAAGRDQSTAGLGPRNWCWCWCWLRMAAQRGCSRPAGCTIPDSAHRAPPATPPAGAGGSARRFASPAACSATRRLPARRFQCAKKRPAAAPATSASCWVRPLRYLRWDCGWCSPTCSLLLSYSS